jgi:hypothetical protein
VIRVARHTGSIGFGPGGRVIVRCREGHLFTTVWIPGASFKAIRLGWVRLQRCPVGEHLTFVTPVRESDLTEQERRIAQRYDDGPVP